MTCCIVLLITTGMPILTRVYLATRVGTRVLQYGNMDILDTGTGITLVLQYCNILLYRYHNIAISWNIILQYYYLLSCYAIYRTGYVRVYTVYSIEGHL